MPLPDTLEETAAWLRIVRAAGLSATAVAQLLENHGSAAGALAAGPGLWRKAGLSDAARTALAAIDGMALDADLRWLAAPDHHLIRYSDPRYPERLRQIAQAPVALFAIGDPDLLAQPQLAVIGARSASPQGLADAQAFAAELARRGLVITSGLALGIDGAAHRGALSVRAPTIAVCGTGLDRVYPARHKPLAHAIAERGLLVSEYPLGTPPRGEHFPRRNRIISGLVLGVLVVEAARESGSLITARLAGDQGREVFAIPGSIHNPMSRGCHRLIRQGAKLVETVEDIFEEIAAPLRASLAAEVPASSANPPQDQPQDQPTQALLHALGDAPTELDVLIERLRWPVGALQAALLKLELEGLVAPTADGRYVRLHGKA